MCCLCVRKLVKEACVPGAYGLQNSLARSIGCGTMFGRGNTILGWPGQGIRKDHSGVCIPAHLCGRHDSYCVICGTMIKRISRWFYMCFSVERISGCWPNGFCQFGIQIKTRSVSLLGRKLATTQEGHGFGQIGDAPILLVYKKLSLSWHG